MKKAIFFIFGLALLSPLVVLAYVGGQEPVDLGLKYGAATGLGGHDVRYTVAMIINALLGLLGIVSVVTIIYAGMRLMTSGGNEEDIKAAQKTLLTAVIGLIVILMAYTITRFVMTSLFEATTGTPYTSSDGTVNMNATYIPGKGWQ